MLFRRADFTPLLQRPCERYRGCLNCHFPDLNASAPQLADEITALRRLNIDVR